MYGLIFNFKYEIGIIFNVLEHNTRGVYDDDNVNADIKVFYPQTSI